MALSKDWVKDTLVDQLGVSAEQILGEVIAAFVLDETMKVLSATRMAARVINVPYKELIGGNLIEITAQKPVWPWVDWVTPEQQLTLLEGLFKDAVVHTATSREINVLTRGQMLYRGSINVIWREADRTFALWCNLIDPLTSSDETIAMTTWVGGEWLHGSRGNRVTQRDLTLLMDYCKTATVRELAEKYSTTTKAMEHRLRRLAESYGCNSITELAKHQMHRRLVTLARPTNTFRVFCDMELMDAVRYRKLPRHVLPKTSSVTDDTKKEEAKTVARRLMQNVFKR